MPTTVVAHLGLRGTFTQPSFQLCRVSAALRAIKPEQLVMCFLSTGNGDARLVLRCEFGLPSETDDGAQRARLWKQCVLDGDIAGDFDCVFYEDPTSSKVPDFSLSVGLPADARLPSGQWLALPVSLLPAAAEVLRHGQASGLLVGYRVDLRARAADPMLARKLVPALAKVSTNRSHASIETALRTAIETVKEKGWAAHESFVVQDVPEHRVWLENFVRAALRTEFRFYPDDFWSMHWNEARDDGPHVQVREARASDFHECVIAKVAPSRENESTPARRREPPPVTNGSYVFLSYAHADRGYATRVLNLLEGAGVNVWHDSGIEPGKVWDEEIEDRIRHAGAVVVCLSAHYESSRYCTRELKFADLLAKPIFPIAASQWVWGAGLQLMFQSLQVGAFHDGRGFASFCNTLKLGVPWVFSGHESHSSP